ncbi:MAG TPA: hypothetical protein VGF82_20080 [Terracidiphilus sp.]
MSGGLAIPLNPPMGIGQILDRAFGLLRNSWKTFVGIALLPPAAFVVTLGIALGGVMIPATAHMPKNPSHAQNLQIAILFFTFFAVVMLIHSAVFAPSLAAGSYAAVSADLGKRVTFKQSYAFALRQYGRHLLLLIIILLIGASPVLLFEALAIIPVLLLQHRTTTPGPLLFAFVPLVFIAFIAVYIFSVVAMLRLSLAFPACVTESLTAVAGVRRSNQLTRGAKGRIFVVLLVVYAISYAIYLVSFCLSIFLFGFIYLIPALLVKHLPLAVSMVVAGIAILCILCGLILSMACTGAGFVTALAVIYNDQRRLMDAPAPNAIASGAPA